MKNNRFRKFNVLLYLRCITVFFVVAGFLSITTGCGNIKNLQYVQGNLDTNKLGRIQFSEPVIQKGDLLGIVIYSANPQATATVTTSAAPVSTEALSNTAVNPGTVSYLVDQQGNIQLLKLGTIGAAGKTKKQLADTLMHLFNSQKLLMNPFVEVRFLNFKITIIGEVNRPGSFNIPTEKISAFEAIGLAGDITTYGRRDNVLIVREVNGERKFAYLDLSKPDVFASPYFYLQQNDLLIVDVAKNKGVVNDQTTVRNVTIATSILSTIAIFITIFRR